MRHTREELIERATREFTLLEGLVADLPDDALWAVRQTTRRKLMRFIRERARDGWIRGHLQPMQAIARGTLLDPEALTIGFARRFATYKRATLLFRDLERLKQLLGADYEAADQLHGLHLVALHYPRR